MPARKRANNRGVRVKSIRREHHLTNNYKTMTILIVMAFIIVVLLAYSSYLLQRSSSANAENSKLIFSMEHPFLIYPPVKFYINTQPNVTPLQTFIPLNQTLCPSSQAIINKFSKLLYYPYYTTASTNTTFTYNLVVNTTSNLNVLYIYLNKPFTLESYSVVNLTVQQCVGYPNALKEIHMLIRTPTSNYTGNIAILIYTNKTSSSSS